MSAAVLAREGIAETERLLQFANEAYSAGKGEVESYYVREALLVLVASMKELTAAVEALQRRQK